ncbi:MULTISPECIES: class I SAM-dependent methyltransferase [Methanobacterium]|jgi:ubiquinone/menaquinone biosynthesis C-methylase UbiE|uniref:class I SAM-dependent methyltransferase n=1 Tax=Methanobacterium TaxID=2160 RepID=UPI0024123CE0|nr:MULTISPECIES: class I SAM-dependent methyltransferase [Methanobacterium]MDG3546872.1 class I SAM-dependent methyltransferase [Methanobacterium formicicum]
MLKVKKGKEKEKKKADKNSQSVDTMLIDGAHAPIYPLIANQIISKLHITEGVAIDVGTGPASLSVAMARLSDLKIYAMDISAEVIQIAQESMEKEGLENRIKLVHGDVHQMPFPHDFADLVFSRGSMFFWKDLPTAFREIYRVLKPGGSAYVGGGFGSAEVKEKVKPQFERDPPNSIPKIPIDTLEKAVLKAGINDYTLINDDSGLWVLFKKRNQISI